MITMFLIAFIGIISVLSTKANNKNWQIGENNSFKFPATGLSAICIILQI